MRARLSRSATHDLVVVDTTGQRLHLVTATSAGDESPDTATLETIATRHLDRPALHAVSMRLNRDAVTDLVLLQPDSEGPSMMTGGVDSVITVNTDLDSAAAGDGACSLREALQNSNTDSDTTAGDCVAGTGADTIEFAIAGGGGTATVVLASALPSITDAVTLDGTTQGCATPPCIALDGSGAGTGVDGLNLAAGSSTVRGLAVQGFGRHGIYVTSSDNVIEGNFVGTDLTGTVDLGNTDFGVLCEGAGATGNVIGGTTAQARNVVSGNDRRGVVMASGANDSHVLGNYIGTDVTGTLSLGNRRGIHVLDSVNATVGGTASGAGNVVSGNDDIGILLEGGSGSTVQGNLVGTDVTGTVDLGNASRGINLANGASNNTVGGTAPGARNIVSGNTNGVHLKPDTIGNVVAGNFVGTDITGTVAIGNSAAGVEIETGSNNTIGGAVPGSRNLISASGQMGVLLENTSGNSVLGNYIGTDVSGSVDLGNNGAGIRLANADDNTIGGTSDDERNVISGNGGNGIFIAPSGVANRILGNFIGIDASGSAPLGNTDAGIEIDGSSTSGNVIGGSEAGAGNVISGNGQMGVLLELTSGNSLRGNYIGTDAEGMADVGNGTVGVLLSNASSNTIGGGLPGEGNLISGNTGNGIGISGASAVSNVFAGNCIGTDVTCRVPLGNGLRGVRIHTNASNNTIGGTAVGDGNVLAFNTEEGVVIDTGAVGNAILGNAVFANGQLGIDLHEDGVTANDTDDPDAGANDLQNYPVLAAANATPSPDVNIDGTLNSTNNQTFRIEFFAGSACGSSGHGEGERYLGSSDQVTGGGGDVSFNVTLAAAVSDGEAITATATNPADSTSEFSACIAAVCSNLVVFGDTLTAQDKDTLVWATAQDVRFSRGDLVDVSSYVTTDDGVLRGADSLDISGDGPAPGEGLYYLVKPLGCGSWQTAAGAEPGRDGGLP
jgi:titin